MFGLNKELRKFMAEVRGEQSAIRSLERQVNQLRKHNELLMDRLMSEGLKDYKVHTIPLTLPRRKEEGYRRDHDENLAGEIVDMG